jgi:putative peptide zinc metalloprotease protein
MALPNLREELDIFEGPKLANGQPSWVLQDPVRQQFFRIDWLTFEILSRWHLNDGPAIIAAIERDTPLEVEPEDLERTAKFLSEQQLLRVSSAEGIQKMAERKQAAQSTWWKWLIHHYLFFRLPLVRPDPWLDRTMGFAEVFFSRTFRWLTLVALVFGLTQVVQQWATFHTFLLDTFTLQGLASYGVALIVVKVLHELGHAYAVKRHGGHVPTMGVAFLVMWPMAYTDTNEAWKIADRGKRLQISSAGIATEAMLAAWALLAWTLLPDGALRSAMFFVASISLGLTIALNASPFMRFDGYFIICDLLEMPNLHQRSFALARWKLREWLFKLNEPKPEIFSPLKQTGLIIFAWATWLYRLVLFIGIALMVYHLFTKILGVLLFIIEIYWFIWFPVRSELREWHTRRDKIIQSTRTRISAIVAASLLLLFAVPIPTHIAVSALFKPSEIWPVHTPGAAVIDKLMAHHGQEVSQGQALVHFHAPDVLLQMNIAQTRRQRLNWQAATAGMPETQQGTPLALLQTQVQSAQAEFDRAQQMQLRFQPQAPFAGRFVLSDPDMRAGQWLDKNEKMGVVIGQAPWRIETWVDEEQARRLAIGASALFISAGLPQPLKAKVVDIDKDSTRALPDGLLSAMSGGHILVREQQGKWIPEYAIYRVSLELDQTYTHELLAVQRGLLSIDAQAHSLGGAYLRHALAILIREFKP